jgi:hypothetical protein
MIALHGRKREAHPFRKRNLLHVLAIQKIRSCLTGSSRNGPSTRLQRRHPLLRAPENASSLDMQRGT